MNGHARWWVVVGLLGMAASTAAAQESGTLSQAELDQLLAPVALYPDALVSQMLMASTYPLEVVQADRWARQNPRLEGDALTAALEDESWDPSIKSLVNFPDVLSMMSEQLDWTTKLGDAFLAQQNEVMNTIQELRAKASAEGSLATNDQQTVTVQQESQSPVIVIESSDPEVVYVPAYNPTVVYGSWPYPAYPPYDYHPPGYVVGTAAVAFGVGVACGAAWGYAWGGCDWRHGQVDVDVDRNLRMNNRIDRSQYRSDLGSRNPNLQGGRGAWQHDPGHRRGATYRDPNVARRFGGSASAEVARARADYRGRAEAGRQDIARGAADPFRGRQSPGVHSPEGRVSNRPGAANRPSPTPNFRGAADRSGNRGNPGGAFSGVGQGNRTRTESQRGQISRSGGQGSRSGGGMSRGGGSRGGGGRGGGGRGGRGR